MGACRQKRQQMGGEAGGLAIRPPLTLSAAPPTSTHTSGRPPPRRPHTHAHTHTQHTCYSLSSISDAHARTHTRTRNSARTHAPRTHATHLRVLQRGVGAAEVLVVTHRTRELRAQTRNLRRRGGALEVTLSLANKLLQFCNLQQVRPVVRELWWWGR